MPLLQVNAALSGIKDPLAQNRAGGAIFGAM